MLSGCLFFLIQSKSNTWLVASVSLQLSRISTHVPAFPKLLLQLKVWSTNPWYEVCLSKNSRPKCHAVWLLIPPKIITIRYMTVRSFQNLPRLRKRLAVLVSLQLANESIHVPDFCSARKEMQDTEKMACRGGLAPIDGSIIKCSGLVLCEETKTRI